MQCPKCAAPVIPKEVELARNVMLRFDVCSRCRRAVVTNLDHIKNSLHGSDKEQYWLQGHLDRYMVTLDLIPVSSTRLTVLDVGAAPGHIARLVSSLFGYALYGLDYSAVLSSDFDFDAYVDDMKQQGVIIRECNVSQDPFPFADETFDLVLLTEVVEHVSNPHHTLSEIFRVLKTNGRLLLSTPNFMRVGNRLREVLGMKKTHHGVKEYAVEEVQELLTDTKFGSPRVVFSDWMDRQWAHKAFSPLRLSSAWLVIKYGLVKLIPPFAASMFIVASKEEAQPLERSA